ncbi:hypothetical protein J4439_06340 [Candidatus Woesearchaeota archaeon]|nr:hypothetical protein [Candidatus Woesearchaeota archaeon]
MRRAQASAEYLIILAVVIILALIVVGVLGGFPQMGSSSRQRAGAAYWQQADIAIVEYSFGEDTSSAYAKLRSNLPNPVNLDVVQIGGTTFFSGPVVLNPGETYVIDSSNMFAGVTCPVAGNAYAFDVYMEYSVPATGGEQIQDGDGNQLTGNCAQ